MTQNDDEVRILREKIAEYELKNKKTLELGQEFVSGVAHELRTPVAVLRGSLEALCDGVVSSREQVDEYHKQMLAESIYLQRLVNDLLEYSRLNSSSFEIFREPVCISDVVSDVCRSLRQIAETKQVELIKKEKSGVYIVKGDYARLRQMFIVVLDNAVKFTPEGGSVTVSQYESEGKYTVCISDTGCGIPEDELKYIFSRFHRVMSAENRSGSGLGLAIAKEIASRHNCDIAVSSREGEGTEFRFTFSSHMTSEELEKYE